MYELTNYSFWPAAIDSEVLGAIFGKDQQIELRLHFALEKENLKEQEVYCELFYEAGSREFSCNINKGLRRPEHIIILQYYH